MKKLLTALLLVTLMVTFLAPAQAATVDASVRYTYAEIEQLLSAIADENPDIVERYPIGASWQARKLWCLEITNEAVDAESKTGIGVFANIHGGERESAACALYFASWLTAEKETAQVQQLLDNYVIYIVPVINPDGYEQSFVYNTRPNLRPTDKNGNAIPFSDPYTDIDGDGYIATLYRGTADAQPDRKMGSFGMESPDWDGNGVLGDDPRTSGIDLNRTFDYQWNRYDIETAKTGVIGGNAWSSAGKFAAEEPEIKAVQNFLLNKPMNALVTLHTGEQSVLYPWCYRAYDPAVDADDIPQMKEIAAKMADAFTQTSGRSFYAKSSYEDYPTSAEMIDYAYGLLNIHAYTIEVYCGGKRSEPTDYTWGNELPEAKWVFYTKAQLNEMGLNADEITDAKGEKLAENEGLWFYTSASAQMVDKVVEGQAQMAEGCRDAILAMMESEPFGEGYSKPDYLGW